MLFPVKPLGWCSTRNPGARCHFQWSNDCSFILLSFSFNSLQNHLQIIIKSTACRLNAVPDDGVCPHTISNAHICRSPFHIMIIFSFSFGIYFGRCYPNAGRIINCATIRSFDAHKANKKLQCLCYISCFSAPCPLFPSRARFPRQLQFHCSVVCLNYYALWVCLNYGFLIWIYVCVRELLTRKCGSGVCETPPRHPRHPRQPTEMFYQFTCQNARVCFAF